MPDMSFHHPSTHTLSKALCSAGTLPAYLAVAAILSMALPSGGFPVEMMGFRADVGVKVEIEFEAVFPVGIRFMRMPSVADDALNPLRFQQMCDPCIMITRVQSHVSGQLPQSLLCFVQDFRKWRDVVDVGRLDMYIDDYIPNKRYTPEFKEQVVEAVIQDGLSYQEAADFTKFKDMTAFKVGNEFIWRKERKVLRLNAEDAGVQAGRRNCRVQWKRICPPRFSDCAQKTHT